jgi:hypothetical protein
MSNEGAGANDEAARILAVQENSRRLGLTWQLAIGTVSTADPITVTLDGDTEAIGMVSMIGAVTVGQRVYVDVVPPSGNFICGVAALVPAVGSVVSYVAARADAGPVTVEVPVFTAPAYTFLAGQVYRATWYGDTSSSASNATALYRVRPGTVAGTIVNVSAYQMAVTAGFSQWCGAAWHFAFTVDTTVSMLLTLQGFGGTVTMLGNFDQTRYLEIVYAGPAALYPAVKTI